MVDISITKENQKRTKSKRVWNSMTFSELMNYSPLEAAKYAVDCGVNTQIYGMPVDEYIVKAEKELKKKAKDYKKEEETKEEVIDAGELDWVTDESEEDDWEAVISIEELREMLTANEIKFMPNTWYEKLYSKAKTAKLI